MHDWTLLSIVVQWKPRTVEFRFRHAAGEVELRATGFRNLHIPCREEWGPSVSVNSVEGPRRLANGNQELRIEMQTGDVIAIEAVAITMPK